VDMRIHDINVEADLNRHNPNAPSPGEPVDDDGSAFGHEPSGEAVAYVDSLMSLAEANTVTWWTGWWPVLHMATTGALDSGAHYEYEISIDLLCIVSLDRFVYDTPMDDHLTDDQIDALAAQGVDDFQRDASPPEAVLACAAAVLMGIVDIFLATLVVCPTPTQLIILYALVTAFAFMMFASLYAIQDAVLAGRMTPGGAIAILLWGVLPALAIGGILNAILFLRFFAKYWQMRGTGWGFRGVWLIGLALYLAVLKFLLLTVVCAMLINLYEMSIVYYGMAAT